MDELTEHRLNEIEKKMEQLDKRFAKIYIEHACIFVAGVTVTAVIGIVVNNIFGIIM